uniref:Uncharacterized protein n=1 Tax=Magallana gigas TaxID=29159 RepID=A0A8W8MMJ6_MAGGI
MSIRLVLRSTDSQQIYSGNTSYDFVVHLPKPLYLQGHWTVSLLEFNLSTASTQPELYVCSNLCQDTVVGERELPLLRLTLGCGKHFIKICSKEDLNLVNTEVGRQVVEIGGMFSKKPYMIPVNPHLSQKEPVDQVVGKHVTPMAAVEERAKEEMKEAIKEKIPHVSEKTIKTQKKATCYQT